MYSDKGGSELALCHTIHRHYHKHTINSREKGEKTMNENKNMNYNSNQEGIFVPNWVLDFVERCRDYMDFAYFGRTLMELTASMRDAAGVHYYCEDDDNDED